MSSTTLTHNLGSGYAGAASLFHFQLTFGLRDDCDRKAGLLGVAFEWLSSIILRKDQRRYSRIFRRVHPSIFDPRQRELDFMHQTPLAPTRNTCQDLLRGLYISYRAGPHAFFDQAEWKRRMKTAQGYSFWLLLFIKLGQPASKT
jgi:hypothetical protein